MSVSLGFYTAVIRVLVGCSPLQDHLGKNVLPRKGVGESEHACAAHGHVLCVHVLLEIEPRAMCVAGTELQPQPFFLFLLFILGRGLTELPRIALSSFCNLGRP